jgi:hypothetical protein
MRDYLFYLHLSHAHLNEMLTKEVLIARPRPNGGGFGALSL